MRIRTAAGRFLTRFGRFIQSLAVMVMKPDDLVEFSRRAYSSPTAVEGWARKGVAGAGLDPTEEALLKRVPVTKGKLLLLCLGGGREAIPLAKRGFEVTGVDFVPELVQQARKNALEQGVAIEGLVQDMIKLVIEPDAYDLACLFAAMYSGIPTRTRRIEMLKRVLAGLKAGGYFLCQFQYYSPLPSSPRADRLRKIFAYLSMGNIHHEKGDMIWRESEFIHTFWSEELLRSEFEQSGFQVVEVNIPKNSLWGSAILRKPEGRPSGAPA